MPSPRARRLPTRALVLALVLVLAGGGWALAQRGGGEVARPAPDAGPRAVVVALVAALDAGDCATARALTARGLRRTVTRWCEDLRSIDHVSVGEARAEEPADVGRPEAAQAARVPISFDLRWRIFRGDDALAGMTSWGYLLTRRDGGPWRVVDHGVG